MNILWYFLTFLPGAIGLLALARMFERFAAGAGFMPVQPALAAIFLFLAGRCLVKARVRTALARTN